MTRLHYLPPSEQIFATFLPRRYFGFPLLGYFIARFPFLSAEAWIDKIRRGDITVNGEIADPALVLKEHDHIITNMGPRQEPPANRELRILYEDEHIRAFNKSAPIPVHPSGRYFKNSMTEMLKEIYPDETQRPVQRLDSTTTGVIVFAKTKGAAGFLTEEFSAGRVHKVYLALVEGTPSEERFTVDTAIGKIAGRGSRWGTGDGAISPKPSVTEFQWLATLDGRSLLKAIPRTGRTNQIRVHISDCGHPIINDVMYGRGSKDEQEPETGLHAHHLWFRLFDREMQITAPWPPHFQPYVERMPKGEF